MCFLKKKLKKIIDLFPSPVWWMELINTKQKWVDQEGHDLFNDWTKNDNEKLWSLDLISSGILSGMINGPICPHVYNHLKSTAASWMRWTCQAKQRYNWHRWIRVTLSPAWNVTTRARQQSLCSSWRTAFLLTPAAISSCLFSQRAHTLKNTNKCWFEKYLCQKGLRRFDRSKCATVCSQDSCEASSEAY